MIRILYLIALFALGMAGVAAQQDAARFSSMESRMAKLESKARPVSAVGAVAFLFGAFCALWAQNSGRNAWLWFFLGLFFSVITVLVLLSKNARDLDDQRRAGRRPFNLQDFRQQ